MKLQAVDDNEKGFVCLSEDYDSAIHDKVLFLAEYQNIADKASGNPKLQGAHEARVLDWEKHYLVCESNRQHYQFAG